MIELEGAVLPGKPVEALSARRRISERTVQKYVDDVNYIVVARNGLKDYWTDVDGDVVIRLCCTILQYR
jgi:hypothetical protein